MEERGGEGGEGIRGVFVLSFCCASTISLPPPRRRWCQDTAPPGQRLPAGVGRAEMLWRPRQGYKLILGGGIRYGSEENHILHTIWHCPINVPPPP